MSILFRDGQMVFDGGSLVFTDDPANCKCCEDEPECSCSQSGIIDDDNYGWQPAAEADESGISATFRYEDSENCDGPNPNRQSGSCSCTVTFTEQTQVSYDLSGNTERENESYDFARILRDGNVMAEIHGSEEFEGCSMQSRSDSNSETLAPGTYTFTFEGDTIDGLYHSGMTHQFNVTFDDGGGA